MFNRILVPLDGSDLATRALLPALALARRTHAEVLLLRVPVLPQVVIPRGLGPPMSYPQPSLDHSLQEAQAYLASLQISLKQPGLVIRTCLRHGEAAEAIARTAAEEKIDLIVMSSHGYSGLTRWLLGSVAEKVLASAPCPVLMIRSSQRLRRMLVPLDGSPLAEQALAPALEIAGALDLSVTLFRAAPTISLDQTAELESLEAGFGYRLQEEMRQEAQAYLCSLAAQYADKRLAIETAVGFEPAPDSILNHAETHQTDLIALATHGRQGLQRWVYGSVTEKVLRGGLHSMFVIRPIEVAPAFVPALIEGMPVPA